MATQGITRGAALAINDLLDACLEVKPGDEVVIASHLDGLYGGDNLVDARAVAWIQAAVQARGANASLLWIDEPAKMHHWRVPPVFLAALKASDVFINNSFDLTIEELKVIQETATEYGVRLGRNFATTPGLLESAWAQTPYELVSEIRYQATVPFGNGGMPYSLTDENGTHLEGTIAPPSHPRFPTYTRRRNEGPGYRPFPEWVFPPINVTGTSGTVVFDRMLSWWSRYIGIPPVFERPIRLTVEAGKITRIEGQAEADALRTFLRSMEPKFGEDVYQFPEIHSGVHPQAFVSPQQCGHPLVTRIVDHSSTCNIHFHIGAPWPKPEYPYWLHITGDLRSATWRVGDDLVHDRGHLTALDHPNVKQVAAKYPDRPGLTPHRRTF
ncbi:MAG: hypothetical protein HY900_05765 [Deltaproteobacteria bacterium]|nr:hypothetical protein [Deltaproteobacteria bacterium]